MQIVISLIFFVWLCVCVSVPGMAILAKAFDYAFLRHEQRHCVDCYFIDTYFDVITNMCVYIRYNLSLSCCYDLHATKNGKR